MSRSGTVTEELAVFFLVEGDAVALYEIDEICRRIAGEGGPTEVWIFGDEMLRAGAEVGEIAPASAGDQDFLPSFCLVVQDGDTPALLSGLGGAHQARRPRSKNHNVEIVHVGSSETAAPVPRRGRLLKKTR